ncbi:hypothetical protein [Streptomyces sp. NPDC006879]|uniref:hypothetical protein n=1 Tax=Streptomyces sp. NPDC006879 TaxID=3364767 RepID=UPI003673AB07
MPLLVLRVSAPTDPQKEQECALDQSSGGPGAAVALAAATSVAAGVQTGSAAAEPTLDRPPDAVATADTFQGAQVPG